MTSRLKNLNDAVASFGCFAVARAYCESPVSAPSSKRLRRYRVT